MGYHLLQDWEDITSSGGHLWGITCYRTGRRSPALGDTYGVSPATGLGGDHLLWRTPMGYHMLQDWEDITSSGGHLWGITCYRTGRRSPALEYTYGVSPATGLGGDQQLWRTPLGYHPLQDWEEINSSGGHLRGIICYRTGRRSTALEDTYGVSPATGLGGDHQLWRTPMGYHLLQDWEEITSSGGHLWGITCYRTGRRSPALEDTYGVSPATVLGGDHQLWRTPMGYHMLQDWEEITSSGGHLWGIICYRTGRRSPALEDTYGVSHATGLGGDHQLWRTPMGYHLLQDWEEINSSGGHLWGIICYRTGRRSPVLEDTYGVSPATGLGGDHQLWRTPMGYHMLQDWEEITSSGGHLWGIICYRTGRRSPALEDTYGVSPATGLGGDHLLWGTAMEDHFIDGLHLTNKCYFSPIIDV